MQASAHILLLLLALLLESYLRLQHRRRQAAGYLAFYWRTRSLLPLATRVTALGQVLLPLPQRTAGSGVDEAGRPSQHLKIAEAVLDQSARLDPLLCNVDDSPQILRGSGISLST